MFVTCKTTRVTHICIYKLHSKVLDTNHSLMLQQRKRVPERRCFIFFVRFFVFCNTFEQGCKSGLPLLYMWRFSGAPSDAGRWQAAEQHMLRDLLPSSREPLDKSPAGGEVYDGLSDTPMYNERIDQSRPRFGICTRIGLSESHPGPMTAEVDRSCEP